MLLTPKQKRHLRGLAHNLKPVVMIGNSGITDGVIAELDARLAHHELLKVRISGQDRNERLKMAADLCKRTNSQLVTTIGHIAVLYRRGEYPGIKVPR
ncbi:MAG: ribosome assembly RNA-binding protein YhbY [Gammaproteobacteria bacterium]|nr:ribosome assembly RNA-binding protein YhbY [Gammaproteobacteria bacterium]